MGMVTWAWSGDICFGPNVKGVLKGRMKKEVAGSVMPLGVMCW
jgi:hypothetical protein